MSIATQQRRKRAVIGLAVIVGAACFGVLAGMWWWPGGAGPAIYFLCKVVLVITPVLWLRFVEKRPLGLSPLREGGWRWMGIGLGLGLAIGAAILMTWQLIGQQWIDVDRMRDAFVAIGLGTVERYIVFVAGVTLFNALMEEYVWRWFVFRRCEEALGPGHSTTAVLFAAILFTAHHVIALKVHFGWGPTALASVGVFLGGVIWSWLYLRSRSIWPGYVSHVAANVAMFIAGGVMVFG